MAHILDPLTLSRCKPRCLSSQPPWQSDRLGLTTTLSCLVIGAAYFKVAYISTRAIKQAANTSLTYYELNEVDIMNRLHIKLIWRNISISSGVWQQHSLSFKICFGLLQISFSKSVQTNIMTSILLYSGVSVSMSVRNWSSLVKFSPFIMHTCVFTVQVQ